MPPGMPPQGGPLPGGAVGEYSNWGQRVGGYLIRGFAGFLVLIPFFVIGAILGDIGVIFLLIGYVFAIAVSIRALIQRGHLGYDFADRVVGQTLLKEPIGAPLGSGLNVFVRGLVHIVDALPCYVGFLWPLWDAKRQTFADKIMTTVVVNGRPQPHDAKALFVNALMFWTPVTKS